MSRTEEIRKKLEIFSDNPTNRSDVDFLLAALAEKDTILESKERALDNNKVTIGRQGDEIERLKEQLSGADECIKALETGAYCTECGNKKIWCDSCEYPSLVETMNPCGHTGFESISCQVCGYPDSRKLIAHYKGLLAEAVEIREFITPLEGECQLGKEPWPEQCCCVCQYQLIDYWYCLRMPKELKPPDGKGCGCDIIRGYICVASEIHENKSGHSGWPHHSLGCECFTERTNHQEDRREP